MNNQPLVIPSLLFLILMALSSLIYLHITDTENKGIELTNNTTATGMPSIAPPKREQNTTDTENDYATDYPIGTNNKNTNLLITKIELLEARVSALEQNVSTQKPTHTKSTASVIDTRLQRMDHNQTLASLLKADISQAFANEIIQRRNTIELKQLELQNRATREGYINSQRYQTEYTELHVDEITLREELGDDLYDSFLYANRFSNRVKVISVMTGSAAESAGINDGDLIINYGQQRIFDWNELKKATNEGELGEYISIDVMRNYQLINLSVPRGPLGVRLGTARVEP